MAEYKLTSLVAFNGTYLYPNIVWENLPVSVRELINGKQDKLISGTNIKTINGESVLGEGNITINADLSAYEAKTLSFTYADGTTADYEVLVKKDE